jgi:putative DNA primase/helicase
MPLEMMHTVVLEPLEWLWPGRILFGKLTMFDGDGGIGKSTIMLDLAARLSRGLPLPDGTQHPPCGSLLLMAEDGAGDTILPRLKNHDAALERIGLLQTITDMEDGMERMPVLPDDLQQIEDMIDAIAARFVVLDPILSYIGDNVNEYRDKEVRRALMPLIALAQRRGIALVCLRHVTKTTTGNAKHRGNASVAFTNLARSVLFAASDPDRPEASILAQSKTNLGSMTPSLRYRMVNCANGHPRIAWEGVSAHTADSLNAQPTSAEDRSELHEAEEFLRETLAGGRMLVNTAKRQAREAGIAEMTLRRAKVSLRVISRKAQTQDGQWTWELPPPKEVGEDVQPNSVSPTLNTLTTMNIFKEYQEDNQDSQEVQGNQDVGHKNGTIFPVALVGGKAQCVECGRTIIRMAGEALICKTCLGSKSAAGDD